MKRLVYIITILIATWQTLPVLAITDKEMEQARVIATQTYLRYANDGSGYLDNLHPSTMAELEKNLKTKEKDNIKAFKAIPVPSGYSSWDKQKLIDYWTTTAFAHAGLEKKGLQAAKSAARKKLNSMKVSSPQPAAAQPSSTTPPSEAKPAATPEQPKQAAPTQPENKNPEVKTSPVNSDSLRAEIDESKALAEVAIAEEEPMIPKEKSNTWIYVVVLCILVAVVVALVVFASNVMKKSAAAPLIKADDSEKNNLEKSLNKANSRVEELEHQNQQLMKRVEALTAEITKLRARPSQPQTTQAPIQGIPYPKTSSTTEQQRPVKESETGVSALEAHESPKQQGASASAQHQQPRQTTPHAVRTIYLGRANAKQIFVRADRSFNPGNSVFRLDTSDGLAGSYKVVSDPSVIELVRQHPAEMLGSACVGPDLGNTESLQAIVTDSAGTAIFEGGRWIVLRKAKIHYE